MLYVGTRDLTIVVIRSLSPDNDGTGSAVFPTTLTDITVLNSLTNGKFVSVE